MPKKALLHIEYSLAQRAYNIVYGEYQQNGDIAVVTTNPQSGYIGWYHVCPGNSLPSDPTGRLSQDEVQDLFESLWRMGFRPKTNASDESALKNHLADAVAVRDKLLAVLLPQTRPAAPVTLTPVEVPRRMPPRKPNAQAPNAEEVGGPLVHEGPFCTGLDNPGRVVEVVDSNDDPRYPRV